MCSDVGECYTQRLAVPVICDGALISVNATANHITCNTSLSVTALIALYSTCMYRYIRTDLPLLAVVPVTHVPLLDALAIECVRIRCITNTVL